MTKVFEGNLIGKDQRFIIIAGRFNELITSKLVSGAQDCFLRHGISSEQVDICWVPGAFEIPLAAKKAAKLNNYQGIVCLGAVIRGTTPHFDYVSSEVSKGVSKVSYDYETPTIFGVLTTDTIEQAIERAGTKSGNKGWEAALSALEMSTLIKQFENNL
ncbi:MAG: 6,7-dimethyl-8-ribityllumazine synthase [Halobacteriovoraceae bacterium]|nr:6,7-dimethyl-8-ribityllumazine synthase [Halobacteriovoraceae bacterium]|tara:strand:- start:279 stop:755 length:477 start_codon:yes stop_codon:yes gene_type:complete